MSSYENRLDKARKIYKDQQREIESLRSPPLWELKGRAAKPDYKAEYKAVLDRAEREKATYCP
jgi:hypothetical protein